MLTIKNKRWNSFSVTNDKKARLHQIEPPNALPASKRCPGQHKGVMGGFFTRHNQFAFGHGSDHPSYVNSLNVAILSTSQF